MNEYLPNIGKGRPLLPPPDCPAVVGEGVDDLRTARFVLDGASCTLEEPPRKQVVEVLGHFSHELGAEEGAVELVPFFVAPDDPIVDLIEEARDDPTLVEEIRQEICPLILSCPGTYLDDEGLHCGALTAAAFRRILESKLRTQQ